MPPAAPSQAAPAPAFDQLPFSFTQQSSRAAAALLILLVLPLLAVVVGPLILILVFAAADFVHAVADKPLAVGMLILGLTCLVAAFLVPAHSLIRRLWMTRAVQIVPDRVIVCEYGLLTSKVWSAPLTDFNGVAHHVRASLSGVRHELILVHRNRSQAVLLHAAERISQATIERAAALFGVPELPARELYRVTRTATPAVARLPNEQMA
jgi:hypothetical protein